MKSERAAASPATPSQRDLRTFYLSKQELARKYRKPPSKPDNNAWQKSAPPGGAPQSKSNYPLPTRNGIVQIYLIEARGWNKKIRETQGSVMFYFSERNSSLVCF